MSVAPRRSLLQAPAIQALFILCVALLLAMLAAQVLDHFCDVRLSSLPFAFLQGAFAAAIAYWRRMAFWWVPILLLFVPAAALMSTLQLPPTLFFLIFLFLLLLFWSTFRSQVPYYPSGLAVWRAVAALLPQDRPVQVIDIGSGLGGAVMYLSGLRPDSRFIGIELAPLPWLLSYLRARFRGSRGQFLRGDYTALDFAEFDAIFAYLSPAAMLALWQKAKAEMRPGSLLMSYEFIIEEMAPDLVVYPRDGGPALYVWHM